MARTTSISFTLGRTISDGKYGSYKTEVTEVVELEEGDDLEKERRRLVKRVKSKVDEYCANIQEAIDSQE